MEENAISLCDLPIGSFGRVKDIAAKGIEPGAECETLALLTIHLLKSCEKAHLETPLPMK